MKKQAYTMIAMIVLVGSMAVAAQAQTSGGARLIANIPFEFNVGDKTMPAGEYVVSQINPSSSRVVLQIANREGGAGSLVAMNPVNGKAKETAVLIFHRYGNRYFFSQAWVDGETSGLEAPKERTERAVQREMASSKKSTESIALTTRR